MLCELLRRERLVERRGMLWMLLGVLRLLMVLRELLVLSVLLMLAMVLLLLLECRLLLLLRSAVRRNDRLGVGVGVGILLLPILINHVGSVRIHHPVP